MQSNFHEELQRCRELVAAFQIERVTNRLMDLCQHRGPARQRNAILLTSRWTQICTDQRRFGDTEQLRADSNRLVLAILEFIDVLESIDDQDDNTHLVTVVQRTRFGEARQRALDEIPVDTVCSTSELTFHRQSRHGTFDLQTSELTFKKATITALVGQNGTGKSTLIDLLGGNLRPGTGEVVHLFGRESKGWYERKSNIAIVRQHPEPWPGLLIDTLLFESSCTGHRGHRAEQAVRFILHRLRIEHFAESTWHSLSGGYKTRFELARAILREPKLLLLDEPLAHLDPTVTESFLRDLQDLAALPEQPIAVVISSQNIFDIEAIASSVIFVNEGYARYAPHTTTGSAFELLCDRGIADLASLFTGFGSCVKIEERMTQHLEFDDTVEAGAILRHLLDHGVAVRYFRDISHSVRRLI